MKPYFCYQRIEGGCIFTSLLTLKQKTMFKATQNKGFQMTFSNDITISVQFGKGNYCHNKHTDNSDSITECEDAEIAIWQGDEWFSFGDDTVKGWVSPDEVATWIAKIQLVQNINQLS